MERKKVNKSYVKVCFAYWLNCWNHIQHIGKKAVSNHLILLKNIYIQD